MVSIMASVKSAGTAGRKTGWNASNASEGWQIVKKAIRNFNKSSPWQKRWQEREPLRLEHIEKERVNKNEKNQSKNHIHRSGSRHMA